MDNDKTHIAEAPVFPRRGKTLELPDLPALPPPLPPWWRRVWWWLTGR